MTATVLLVFARGAGFFARVPGISRSGIPPALRAGFAFALALAIAPGLPRLPAVDALSFAVMAASEAMVGAILGLAAQVVAEAVACAGRLLDDAVGLRLGVSPAVAPPGFGGLWSLAFVVGLFASGGIERLILAFAQSFSAIPLGAGLDAHALARFGPATVASLLRVAVEAALPALGIAMLVQAGFAALGRVMPRFANLFLGFPAAYAGVTLAAFAGLGWIRELAQRALDPAAFAALLR